MLTDNKCFYHPFKRFFFLFFYFFKLCQNSPTFLHLCFQEQYSSLSCIWCVCAFEWPAVVNMLMDRIHVNTGLTFNSVLANLYRDGHDHVSWHADDEPSLRHQPTIASLSFGDTRTFHLRKNPPQVRLL